MESGKDSFSADPINQGYDQQAPYFIYHAPAPQDQQSINVVVVGNQQPGVAVARESFAGPITLSCFVFWCCGCGCGWPFALIAFIMSMVGLNSASNGDQDTANQMLRASYRWSIIGAVIGFIVTVIVVVYFGVVAVKGCDDTYCIGHNYYYDARGCKVC